MGKICRLRPIRILVASQDPRYERVVSFLLHRYGFDVVTANEPTLLPDTVERYGPVLAVVDAESFPDHRSQLETFEIDVVLVAEHPDGLRQRDSAVLTKWGPFEDLLAEIDRRLAEAPVSTAGANERPPWSEPAAQIAAAVAPPKRQTP